MKYTTAGAFRQALEERLRQQTFAAHPGLTRLRKMIAFDRFLARLAGKEPTSWVLTDGFAIQLRFGAQARATKDIDLAVLKNWSAEEAADWLRDAASLDLRDWFEFEISEPSEAATGAPKAGFRFPVRCLLDGRAFENFHLDVGIGDVILDSPELVTGPPLLDFAEITPATVPCYPLTAQIAEKVHTYTRTYASGLTSRARDLRKCFWRRPSPRSKARNCGGLCRPPSRPEVHTPFRTGFLIPQSTFRDPTESWREKWISPGRPSVTQERPRPGS